MVQGAGVAVLVNDNVDLLLGEETPTQTEFTGAELPRPQIVQILPPDPTKMQAARLKQYTQQKIREAFHQLAMNNLDSVQGWLHELAKDSPAAALDRFIELAKFSLPQLKETAVTVNNNQGRTITFTSSADIAQQLKELE